MRLKSAFLSLLSGNALVTAANLLRDVSLAAVFGATIESDVLFLAISIPVFMLSVGAIAFQRVVVPALSRLQVESGTQFQNVAKRFVFIGFKTTGLLGTALAALAAAFYFVEIPVALPETRRLFTLFLVTIVPMYIGGALIELLQAPLQVKGRFLVPSLLKLGLPVGIIVGVLTLPDQSIFAASIGGAIGVLFALAIGIYLLRVNQMLPDTHSTPLAPAISTTTLLGFKAIIAATLITYANPLIDQWVAGTAGPGAVSMLGYANRLMTGVVALISGALGQVLLIHLSKQVGDKDRAGLTATYRLFIRVMPWVGCAATLGVWLTSQFLVSMLYQRGSFDAEAAATVADLVNWYALQFPVFWTGIAGGILVFALSMNHILVRIGMVLFVTNVLGDLVFLKLFGVQGIPLSTTVVLLISVVLINFSLHKANHLDIRLADWGHAALPVSLLTLSGLLINRFNIGVASIPDLKSTTLALLMFSVFSCCALAFSVREIRRYQSDPVL